MKPSGGLNVWLTQSHYSFLQGASSPRDLVQAAASKGYGGLCVADFDGVYGLVQAHLARQSFLKEREGEASENVPRLFFAAQLLLDLPGFEEFTQPDGRPFTGDAQAPVFLQNRIVFVARSKQGYAALGRLVSYVHREGKQAMPLSPEDAQAPWPTLRECLPLLPCRGASQLFSERQGALFERWIAHVQALARACGGTLFLALTPPSTSLEHNAFGNHLAAHARLGLPLVATDDVFFHESAQKDLHDVLTSIRRNEPVAECRWSTFRNAERTFHSPSYLESFFRRGGRASALDAVFAKALRNNRRLARYVNFGLHELSYRYPQEFIPAGFNAQSYLAHLVGEACRLRYGSRTPPKTAALVEKELALVEELQYADYFLTVWDIVRFAREQGILCQGRGSAANSAVCFLIGITALDPEEYDLVFERFVSRERGEPPDIDVDFEHERREEVIQYIYARYGRTRAAMVANVISFQKKGALRAVGKALGASDAVLGAVQRVFVDRHAYALPLSEVFVQAARVEPALQEFPLSTLEVWAQFARALVGVPRHLGLHSGGFVLSHEPLSDIVPVEPASMEGRSVIQWNKDDIEALGLFKVDVLALGMLTALRKTFSMLCAHGVRLPGTQPGVPVRLDTIPPDCPHTYALIRRAETTGVFQIESRAQMSMLPRLLPRVFYDLVIEVAIVRPGPIVGNMVHPYLKRRHGQEPVEYPDGRLRPILEKTLGVPIFQEQVMRIAVAVGNFTPGEADELRRSMGAWKFKGTVSKFEEKLLAGMRDNGIPEAFAQNILGQIQGFSEYGFPESHAVSFALLAYASSYLKAHFPVYFLCGLLNSQPLGFYSVHSLLQESRHRGHTHLPPCILSSHWDSFVVPPPKSVGGVASRPSTTLRLGLALVSGVSVHNGEVFVKRRTRLPSRKHSPGGAPEVDYEDILALFQECFTSREQVALVMAGVFHVFEPERRTVLWHVLARPSALRPDTEARRFLPKPILLEAWDVLRDDYKHLRTSLGPHAVSLVKKLAWPFPVPVHTLTLAKDVSSTPPKKGGGRDEIVTVMGLAVVRQMPPTAKGMMFITLEDETGTMNLVLQPQVAARDRAHLVASDLLCVTAKRQRNGTACTLLVVRCHPFLTGPVPCASGIKEIPFKNLVSLNGD